MKKLLIGLLMLVIMLSSGVAMAIEFEVPKDDSGNANISLDTEVLDNYFAVGNQVTVDAKIDGDAFLFASIVNLKSEITNNAIVGAQNVNLTGNVRRDLFVGASNFTLDKDATVEGNLYLGAGLATIKGTVKGDIYAGTGALTIDGTVDGNIKAQSDSLELGVNSVTGGTITYTSNKDMKITDGAVYGEIIKKTPTATKSSYKTSSFWSSRILSLLGILLVGIVLLTLFPKKTSEIAEAIKTKFWGSLGLGLLLLIVTPVVIMISLVTMIGFPLAMIIFGFYMLVIYLAKIYVGLCFGNYLTKGNWSSVWSMTIGVILLYIIYQLPWIGGIVGFVILLSGLGGMILVFKDSIQKK